jgi:hypothetical protein
MCISCCEIQVCYNDLAGHRCPGNIKEGFVAKVSNSLDSIYLDYWLLKNSVSSGEDLSVGDVRVRPGRCD